MCIYDRDPNGVATLVTDVLLVNAIDALTNLNNTDRYIIIFDRIHTLGAANAITGAATYSYTTGDAYAHAEQYKSINLPFEGPSTGGAVAGINTGAMYFFAVTDSPTLNNGVNIRYSSRIRYIDN
jgi:hypothetical protein